MSEDNRRGGGGVPHEPSAGPEETRRPVDVATSLSEELAGDLGTDVVDSLSVETTAGASNAQGSVLRSSVVMGVGTVVSRFGGMIRGIVLAFALGAGLLADAFNLGNTLPNVVYIIVIGGALNAVFIPELVRHMSSDDDGGQGYADRLITLVGTLLLLVTIAAVALAPWIVRIYATSKYTQDQLDLATAFARFCLPQIFFYGVYTMLSQVLNARGHFGAPTFAPMANNIVAIVTFAWFAAIAGPSVVNQSTLPADQTALLGIGTTLGVVAQALVLIPVLVRMRYVWRPNLHWRGAGLGTAGSLAFWTIGLVLVNQLAYVVIVRLATTAGVVASTNDDPAAGLTSYTNAHLIFILPHSVVTVSVVAALLPRMSRAAHDVDYRALAADIGGGMRSVASLIIPASIGLIVLGTQAGILLFGYGGTSAASAELTGQVAAVLAVGLLPFSLYYVIQRGWYALELTRTAFWVTVVLNAVYLAIAVPLFTWTINGDHSRFALLALAAGYAGSYWVTLILGWTVISRRIGGLETGTTVRRLTRMAGAGAAMLVVMLVAQHLLAAHFGDPSRRSALLDFVVVGSLGTTAYVVVARLLGVGEVTTMLDLVRRRLPGR